MLALNRNRRKKKHISRMKYLFEPKRNMYINVVFSNNNTLTQCGSTFWVISHLFPFFNLFYFRIFLYLKFIWLHWETILFATSSAQVQLTTFYEPIFEFAFESFLGKGLPNRIDFGSGKWTHLWLYRLGCIGVQY